MPHILKFNYGSFNFEHINNILLALAINLYQAPSELVPVFKQITTGDNAKVLAGLSLLEQTLNLALADKTSGKLLSDILERRIVKNHFNNKPSSNFAKDISQLCNSALAAFATITIFPITRCDFSELYRMMNDLGDAKQSLEHNNAPGINKQLKDLALAWNQASKTTSPEQLISTIIAPALLTTPEACIPEIEHLGKEKPLIFYKLKQALPTMTAANSKTLANDQNNLEHADAVLGGLLEVGPSVQLEEVLVAFGGTKIIAPQKQLRNYSDC